MTNHDDQRGGASQAHGGSQYGTEAGGQSQFGQAQPYGAGQYGGAQPSDSSARGGTGVPQDASPAGFFASLFDFSFSTFITPKVVKFVYMIALAALVLGWLSFLFGAFGRSAGYGLVVLVLGPIFILLYLVFIRITLEFYLAMVRMSEDIHQRLR